VKAELHLRVTLPTVARQARGRVMFVTAGPAAGRFWASAGLRGA
jgi:hypothetical protein